ncbi:restriction endonuclease-like protein [Paenibacillus koleovorans]|uniref:restriction endonuclease-like protein n=1 Tax=Paenibacillus koleovorans TaxID=121608 RepID=UPI000FD7EB90|nr:restriction endonuclease-like protein [Paenibacillus koleovorans]
MGLLPSGFPNESRELLQVATNLFDVTIKGKPLHPTVETLQLHRTDHVWEKAEHVVASHSAILQVEEVKLFSVAFGEWVDGLGGAQVEPCFYETQSYEVLVEARDASCQLEFWHASPHLRKAVKPTGKSGRLLSGVLQFQNEIGYTDLEIRVNGGPGLHIRLEIFPSKLDYKKDYYAILQEVNRQIYNLSFDFLRKTYHLTGLKQTHSQSLTEYWAILKHVFQQLTETIERIDRAPHYRLYQEKRVTDAAKVKKAGRENVRFLAKRPQLLVPDREHGILQVNGQPYRPTSLVEAKRKLDYDTAENRFLRWMLERIDRKLSDIREKLVERERSRDTELEAEITRMKARLRRLLQLDFLREVGELRQMNVSLVLQMAPGYRDVYRIYLMLMKGLSIQSDLFHLSMKDLAQLYEYWCFLKIHELLANKYQLIDHDIIRVNRTGLFVTLDKSQRAKVEYENPRNGERFVLYYNALPSEDREAPTLAQKPDNVLTLYKHDAQQQPQVFKYVFDAKYRLNPAYEGSSYYNNYQAPGPEEDDINTMHRYRDAIVYQELGTVEFERSMFGAYVLFPYADEERFKEHRFYRSIGLINIGAFPFLPGTTGLMENFLDELILDSPEKAYERSTQPRGTKSYYRNKLGGKNVLVGSMRTGQLEVVLEQSFYHMPLRNLPDQKLLTQLEYIALCQSRRQHQKDGGIRYYGRIREWEVRKRGDIKERPARPGTEQELYVYFSIEKWEQRATVIALGGSWIETCLATSKYMFDRAVELPELRLETEEQLREWREKRRRGKVKVELDHVHVDRAGRVLGIGVEENHTER